MIDEFSFVRILKIYVSALLQPFARRSLLKRRKGNLEGRGMGAKLFTMWHLGVPLPLGRLLIIFVLF